MQKVSIRIVGIESLNLTKSQDVKACHDVSIKLGLPPLVASKHDHVCHELATVVAAAHVVHAGAQSQGKLKKQQT